MDEPASGREVSWVRAFVLVAISRFGIFFSHRQAQPVFPVYLSTLGASGLLIGFIMSSFTITATVARPFVGLWIDRSGRKGLLLLGTVIMAATALGYAWAPNLVFLVGFRMIHGLGWSACTTTLNTLAVDIAPADRRGAMLAYAGLASNLGAALGPLAGFAAYERFGFHGMFLTVFCVIVMSLLFVLPIRESQRPAAKVDRNRSWFQLLFVRESFLPSMVMTFVAFGHAGVTTYIPLYVLEDEPWQSGALFRDGGHLRHRKPPYRWAIFGPFQPARRDPPWFCALSRRSRPYCSGPVPMGVARSGGFQRHGHRPHSRAFDGPGNRPGLCGAAGAFHGPVPNIS